VPMVDVPTSPRSRSSAIALPAVSRGPEGGGREGLGTRAESPLTTFEQVRQREAG
jgi:hypothetical protein